MTTEKDLDPKKLEQLYERQKLLHKKYALAYAAGASQDVLNQIVSLLDDCKQAIWEYSYIQSFKDSQKAKQSFDDSIL